MTVTDQEANAMYQYTVSGTEATLKYPAGGSPIAVFSGNFDLPLGTVAAEK